MCDFNKKSVFYYKYIERLICDWRNTYLIYVQSESHQNYLLNFLLNVSTMPLNKEGSLQASFLCNLFCRLNLILL